MLGRKKTKQFEKEFEDEVVRIFREFRETPEYHNIGLEMEGPIMDDNITSFVIRFKDKNNTTINIAISIVSNPTRDINECVIKLPWKKNKITIRRKNKAIRTIKLAFVKLKEYTKRLDK